MTDRFEPKEEEIDADDYRAYFTSSILRVWHLQGKQRLFRINRVTRLTSEMFAGGKRTVTMQPKLELATRDGEIVPLPFLLNKVNSKIIAQLYGKRPSGWVGQWIQLYPATTELQGEIVDCIRVRPEVPGSRPRRTNRQGANVLPPPAPSIPPSDPLDHARATKNDDDDTMEAEYEIVQ